ATPTHPVIEPLEDESAEELWDLADTSGAGRRGRSPSARAPRARPAPVATGMAVARWIGVSARARANRNPHHDVATEQLGLYPASRSARRRDHGRSVGSGSGNLALAAGPGQPGGCGPAIGRTTDAPEHGHDRTAS